MLPNSEWLLLAILAIILLKPEDIPVIARFIGKLVHQAQQMWSELAAEFNQNNTSTKVEKMHPFHGAPPKAKVQPMKD
jgi:Sec-independent protein translocase protein TatA